MRYTENLLLKKFIRYLKSVLEIFEEHKEIYTDASKNVDSVGISIITENDFET